MNVAKKILLLFFWGSTACSSYLGDVNLDDQQQDVEGQSVSIQLSQDVASRTTIDPDDMSTTRWSTDDALYLWSVADGASGYTFENVEFKLMYYSPTYDKAVFTTTIDPMEEGDYTYFGVYPKPESVSGTQVSFDIPELQSGAYDGDLDIMVANPVSYTELGENTDEDFPLTFSHLMHAIRINIPEARNLFGSAVQKLQVTFPREVVGSLSFDASSDDPQVAFYGNSSVVTLDMESAIDEEEGYAWIFIAPTQLEGLLSFVGYTSDGCKSETISVSITKTMAAGRITPITLTVPVAVPTTSLKLTVEENYLGEEPHTVTFTAPSGAQFVNESSTIEFPWSDSGEYTLYYYTDDYHSAFSAGSLDVSFESESAIVSADPILLSSVVSNQENSLSCDVPYLMFNDFSGVSSSFEYYTDPGSSSASHYTTTLDSYGLTGWTADRCGGVAGTSIRTMCRLEGGMWAQALYDGRIDTEPLSNLKDGKSVTIKVTYNYSGSKNEYAGSAVGTIQYSDGYTDTTGSISSKDNTIEFTMGSSMNPGTTGSYTSIPTTNSRSYTSTSKCTSSTRLSWQVTVSRSTEFAQGGNYWLYIDNVRVEIVN